jgi:hypothetical protein
LLPIVNNLLPSTDGIHKQAKRDAPTTTKQETILLTPDFETEEEETSLHIVSFKRHPLETAKTAGSFFFTVSRSCHN